MSTTSSEKLPLKASASQAAEPDAEYGSHGTIKAGDDGTQLNQFAVWGLYCNFALVGIVYGFTANYMTLPICQYVFGPMGEAGRTTIQQCNIAPIITQVPWSMKVFYGVILDRIGLFGTRRRGWIIGGWTCALVLLAVLSVFAGNLLESHSSSSFATYTMFWMLICIFYMFADVAGDGMVIELSKLEPEDRRGYILTTGQMVRFSATLSVNVLGMLAMNGPSYYPNLHSHNQTVFSFELSFGHLHLALLAMCAPLWVLMVSLLRDPPRQEHACDNGTLQVVSTMWVCLKTKAMLFLIIYSLGSVALSGMLNPAANVIQSIALPSTLQSSTGSLFGNLLFLLGVWIFRAFFINWNWRFTFVWTSMLTSLNCLFQLLVIHNAWGIGRNGWFFAFGGNLLHVVQGIAQVLSSLAVIEVSPAGFEATVYEFLTTMHNCGVFLNSNLQNLFVPIFSLNEISATTYFPSLKHPFPPQQEYNLRMSNATYFTLVVNVITTLGLCCFAPSGKEECRTWLRDKRWHRWHVGIAAAVGGGGLFILCLTVSFLSIMPSTMCLRIAGGDGC